MIKKLKIIVLFFLLTVYGLTACQKNSTFDFENADFQNGTMTDDFEVTMELAGPEPIRTDNRLSYNGQTNINAPKKLLGASNDPIFGTNTAEVAVQLVVPEAGSFNFPEGGVLDSAILILAYTDTTNISKTYYGKIKDVAKFRSGKSQYEAADPMYVYVQELASSLDISQSYYSDAIFLTKGINLVKDVSDAQTHDYKKFTPTVGRPVWVMDFVKDGKDTLRNDGSQIRIPIDADYARQVFINAPRGTYDNQASFDAYFKGLKIYADGTKLQPEETGGIIYLNMYTLGASKLRFYYHTVQDTIVRTLWFSTEAPQVNTFSQNYMGSPVGNALQNGNPNKEVYMQAMGGVRTKITFPNLKEKMEGRTIAINKAELVVVPEGGEEEFAYPAKLTLNGGQTRAGTFLMLPDYDVNDTRPTIPGVGSSGNYNSDNNNYSIQLTKYVQDVIDGKEVPEDLYLTVEKPAQEASRGQFNNGSTAYSIKLRIIYSNDK